MWEKSVRENRDIPGQSVGVGFWVPPGKKHVGSKVFSLARIAEGTAFGAIQ
jgi:hypothetical protein